ncbi:hypothetical protein BDY19DRAFT_901459 [Irpex rosettiformis]|uniref:Uncharacterized protein n=1 Tax=Irpex rosettiformis TaxID=378272 RepID=A0ACB8UIL9_9APHY|nr:hypothetical protein BDY19DRAFT_901459 [Irpex rosettiformis]
MWEWCGNGVVEARKGPWEEGGRREREGGRRERGEGRAVDESGRGRAQGRGVSGRSEGREETGCVPVYWGVGREGGGGWEYDGEASTMMERQFSAPSEEGQTGGARGRPQLLSSYGEWPRAGIGDSVEWIVTVGWSWIVVIKDAKCVAVSVEWEVAVGLFIVGRCHRTIVGRCQMVVSLAGVTVSAELEVVDGSSWVVVVGCHGHRSQ